MAWDEELIRDIFTERDVNLILQIPPRLWARIDVISWDKDKKGAFTVKSGYKFLYSITPDEAINYREVWKRLWNSNTPPKVKIFIWTAACNVLPTMVQLLKKRVNMEEFYSVCYLNSESTKHTLFRCHFAQDCWRLSNIGFLAGNVNSVMEGLSNLFSSLDFEVSDGALVLMWGIWDSRNKLVWNQTHFHLHQWYLSPLVSCSNRRKLVFLS
ncbi:hypothetical protein P3X46_005009 [Hevea brasiliensis]|uniref:Reverse transcriptase zinc-binding domain-containing protein n=1 Tax=Hevea brasiliensis TaxID=3981 RepID=A0ABQ9N0Z4_HEVBR|nr:uncharacterized protein LOC110638672 [Hevea brasiliensis]KAJ9185367.1 hypothetical protein P3X46_005009 [Hevea brasiliensis]